MRNTYLTVGIIVVILVIVAFAIVRTRLPKIGQSSSPTPTPVVEATSDQNTQLTVGKHTPASTAVVDKVVLSKPGFVVISEDQSGQPGAVLGTSDLLPAGTHENLMITLTQRTVVGQNLLAQVHQDNGDGKFDAGSDEVSKNENGSNQQAQFAVVSASDGGFQTPATGLGEDDEY